MSGAPNGRRSLDEQLEIERDRRRRVVAALLHGAEARPQTTAPDPWAPLLAGLAVVVAVVLIVVLGTLVRASVAPAARPSPAAPPVPSSSVHDLTAI